MHRPTPPPFTTLSISVLALLVTASTGAAEGLAVRPDGAVVGWDIQPFTRDNGSIIDVREGHTIANDYAPIAFPGIGRVPSPGNGRGEAYDLEEMHIEREGATLRVLVVTSSAFVAEGRWLLGDLFIEAGGQRLAVATQPGGRPLEAGAIHPADADAALQRLQPGEHGHLDDPRRLVNDFGGKATVGRIVGPWRLDAAVANGQPLGRAAIRTARHDYGGVEDETFLIEYTIDLDALGLADYRTFTARIGWGRGSDVITAGIGGPSLLNLAEEPYALRSIGLDDGGLSAGAAAVGRGLPGVPGGSVRGGQSAGGGSAAGPTTIPDLTPVPEPSTLLLLAPAAMLLAFRRGPPTRKQRLISHPSSRRRGAVRASRATR